MLTRKQEEFCQQYLIQPCGAKAARAAGYSAKCARQTAHKLLNNGEIKRRIHSLRSNRKRRLRQSQDWVILRLQEIAENPRIGRTWRIKALESLSRHSGDIPGRVGGLDLFIPPERRV